MIPSTVGSIRNASGPVREVPLVTDMPPMSVGTPVAISRDSAQVLLAICGVLLSIEPAMAAIAGWVLLDQGLRTRDILAIALVTAASVVVVRAAPPPAEA